MKIFFTCNQLKYCDCNPRKSNNNPGSLFLSLFPFVLLMFFGAPVLVSGQGTGSTVAGFEVDASFKSGFIPTFWKTTAPNQTYFGGTGNDWSQGPGSTPVLTQVGGVSVPGLTADRTAIWQIDGNWGTNVPPDMSVFAGSSNKNGDLIGAGQSPYAISTGSGGPQKNDITNVMLHTRRVSNNLWLFFAAETRSINGSSYLDFEYNQAGVTTTGGNMIGQGLVGGRTVNDILLVINYTQGGKTPIVGVRTWLANGTWSAEIPLGSGNSFMTTNTLPVDAVAPNASYEGDGTPASSSLAFQVVEGGLNISSLSLGGLDQCAPNATVTVKTRSSASYTSELKDWDILSFPLTPTSSASVAIITPQCRNLNGTNVFSVTGTYADGTPLWSTSAGTLSNQSYVNNVATATLTINAPTASATVTLTTSSPNPNCSSAVASKTAVINEKPTVLASATPTTSLSILTSPPQYYLHTTVNGIFDPSNTPPVVAPAPYTFGWTQDPATTGLSSTIIPNPEFSAPAAGEYTWTVLVTDVNGCTNTSSVTRELIPQAPCPAVQTPAMCAGTSYTFSADVAPAVGETWIWSVFDADADATNNPSISGSNGLQSVTVIAGSQNFTLRLTQDYTNPVLADQVCDFAVTVKPNPVGSADPQTVCSGGTTSITLNSDLPSTTFTWTAAIQTSPTAGTITGHSACASSCGSSIAHTLANTGTSPGVIRYTVTPVTNGCTGTAFTVDVIVNPVPNVAQPGNQILCQGESTTLITFSTTNTGGTTTYSWTNSAASIGLAASGTTSTIVSFVAGNTGTTPVVATIVVTPTFTNGGVSCEGASKTFTITVNPKGQVNQPGNQVLCNGASTNLVTFGTVNSGGTTTYSWTNSAPSIGLAASGTTSTIASFVAGNTGTAPVVATIVVTPTFENAGVSCQGPTKTFTITVNPTGQVNQPGNQILCKGESTTAITFGTTNTGGTTSYAWTNSAPSIGLAASGTSSIIASFVAGNTGTAPVVATIEVTPTFTNGEVSCVGPSKTFTITVNPAGQVNQPDNQTLCNGKSTTLVTFGTTNTGGTTTYSWTNSAPSIGLAASGTTSTIASFVAGNTGTTAVVATIVVTPTFTNAGVSCQGPTKTFTITVNPDAGLPGVTLVPITCTDKSFSIQISSPGATTTYDIYQLDGNHVTETPPHSSPLIVSGLTLGEGYRVIATSGEGCQSAPADCGDFSNFEPNLPGIIAKSQVTDSRETSLPSAIRKSTTETVKIELSDGRSSVTAAPNPFSDRIRFSVISEVSGHGSLDLYNMLGQKVKTVYQGYFEKSMMRTFEYHVPVHERANLIYFFSIGNQKTSGKLIGLK